MTCRHAKGDPNCSSTVGGYAWREARAPEAATAEYARTPDAETYEVLDVARVGSHLVLKVRYPNCEHCAYEGSKVMVFLNVTEADVLRWRWIDPHFRDPKAARTSREAPPPAARYPASADGWADALVFAHGKVVAPPSAGKP